MKEYLAKNSNGEYQLVNHRFGDDDIEVPEGAWFALNTNTREPDDIEINFYNKDLTEWCSAGIWRKSNPKVPNDQLPVLWQRNAQPHNHYFKDVSNLDKIDVYQVLRLFNVTDPCLQHIVKKALCAGQRGHKDFETDLKNIRDTAIRAVEINCNT